MREVEPIVITKTGLNLGLVFCIRFVIEYLKDISFHSGIYIRIDIGFKIA